MRLYIDEDSIEALLVRLLTQAGHDVVTALTRTWAGSPMPFN